MRRLANIPTAEELLPMLQSLELNHYKQVEALTALYHTLDIQCPLPPMRGWPISPDFGVEIVSQILEQNPKLIIEFGSGSSTILAAYALRKVGAGRIISVEHDADYAKKTLQLLNRHGLSKYAQVAFAPIIELEVKGQRHRWYDPREVPAFASADILIIDGPPSTIDSDARYPALALFYDRLSAGAVILLDDGKRLSEQKTVELWKKDHPELVSVYLETEKGAFLLRKP